MGELFRTEIRCQNECGARSRFVHFLREMRPDQKKLILNISDLITIIENLISFFNKGGTMHKKIFAAIAVLILVTSSGVYAGNVSLGAKAGSLGAGIEASASFSDSFSARVGVNYFKIDYSGTEDDIDYEFDLTLASVSAFLDWHPTQGAFRVSAGALYNGNELEMDAKSSNTYEIGDTTYQGSEVGTLTGEIDFDDVAPYVGVGWDTSFGQDNRFGFICDIGVIYQGSPEANLTANGPLASDPTFQSELAKEEQNLQDEIDDFEFYPVIAAGFSYRF